MGQGEDGVVLYLHLFLEFWDVGLFQACLVQVLFVLCARLVLAVHDEGSRGIVLARGSRRGPSRPRYS